LIENNLIEYLEGTKKFKTTEKGFNYLKMPMKWQNYYNKLLSKITNYYCYRYGANYYQLYDNYKNSLLTAIAIVILMESSSNNNDYYILLVEDEKDIIELFTEYLSSSGFNTISFQNPMEALNYFYQNQGNCSLVITDYKMPQMSGLELIEKVREKDTDCKIKTIVISAFLKDNLPYDKSYFFTVDKILEKPVYLDRLKKVIQELISTIDIQQKA